MIKLYDRIKELSYVIGTGNITLAGATRGFSTFSSCYSNGDSFFYGITDGTVYELGSGVYVSSSNQIQRFPVKSTNSNNRVNFTEGTKEVYVNYPATNSVFNTSGINPVPQNSGIAFWTSSNSLSYTSNFIFDSGNSRVGISKSSPSVALDIGGNLAYSQLKVSGIVVSESGIYFPSGNNGISSYSGGRQLVHFQPNQLGSQLSTVLELSGIVNQNILLKKQNSNMVFAGPSGFCDPPCGPDYPTFRILTKYDVPQEIPNLDIGNDDSSVTFLRIFLPNGLPDNTYRDINAIEVNSDSNVFAVNGLGNIDIGTIGYSQVTDLDDIMDSVSGTLNSRITAVSGVINAASGALNSRITAVSGYLDTKINNSLSDISASTIVADGRLSIASGNSTIDGSGSFIYYTKYSLDNKVSLYNTSSNTWVDYTINNPSNISLNLNNATDRFKIYDIFLYYNGSLRLSAVPWSGFIYNNDMAALFPDFFTDVASYATTGNLSSSLLSGTTFPAGSISINGQTIVAGNVILVKSQTDPVENGIYEITQEETGLMFSRIYPYDSGSTISPGIIFYISNVNKLYQLDLSSNAIIGTDPLIFTEVPLISFGENKRSSSLTKINNAYVLSSDFSKRYVGTIQTLGPNGDTVLAYDTPSKRLIYNAHNKVNKSIYSSRSAISWSYQSSNWRILPYVDKVHVLCGLSNVNDFSDRIDLEGQVYFGLSDLQSTKYYIGVGKNDQSIPTSGNIRGGIETDYGDNVRLQLSSSYSESPTAGWHSYYLVEKSKNPNYALLTIDNNLSNDKVGGMFGMWEC